MVEFMTKTPRNGQFYDKSAIWRQKYRKDLVALTHIVKMNASVTMTEESIKLQIFW